MKQRHSDATGNKFYFFLTWTFFLRLMSVRQPSCHLMQATICFMPVPSFSRFQNSKYTCDMHKQSEVAGMKYRATWLFFAANIRFLYHYFSGRFKAWWNWVCCLLFCLGIPSCSENIQPNDAYGYWNIPFFLLLHIPQPWMITFPTEQMEQFVKQFFFPSLFFI